MGSDLGGWLGRVRAAGGRAPLLGLAGAAAVGVWVADGLPACRGDGWVRVAAWVGALACLWLLGKRRLFATAWTALVVAGMLHYSRQVLAPGRRFAASLPERGCAAFDLCGRVLEISPLPESRRGRDGGWFLCELDFVRPLGPPVEGVAEVGGGAVLGARVGVLWRGVMPPCGARVWMRAGAQRIPAARNPGQWDAAGYFHRMGLWVEAQVRDSLDGAVLEWPGDGSWMDWPARLRRLMVRELGRGLEGRPVTQALVASMVLGLRGEGLEEEEEWFRHTGTLHLFAVSGLNLAMLASFLLALARVVPVDPRWAACGVVPVLVLYAAVTGGSPSCVRALVMSVLGLAVCWIGRPAAALNSMGAAALLLLVWDGNVLFRPAFLLSFWMVIALVWVSAPLHRRVWRWAYPDALLPPAYWTRIQRLRVRLWRPAADSIAVSLVAWCASLPPAVLLFHEITPVAVIANLLLTPFAFGILALGFLALFASPLGHLGLPGFLCGLSAALTPAFNRVNGCCADAVLGIVRFCSRLPGAHTALADPWRRVPDFTVFDVGEGGAVLIRDGERVFLLDCGREEQVWNVIQPALRLYGIGRIHCVVFSHGDVSHLGGGPSLIQSCSIGGVWVPALTDRSAARRELEKCLAQNPRIPVERVGAGRVLEWEEGGKLEVLYPPGDLRGAVSDDKGLVVRWSSPRGSVLYTADAGLPTEWWLLQNCGGRLASDVWVRGQNSREITGVDDFVRAVSPRIIVAGYPGRKSGWDAQRRWEQHWTREGVEVFSQRETGAVEGFWRDGKCFVRGFCGKTAIVALPCADSLPGEGKKEP